MPQEAPCNCKYGQKLPQVTNPLLPKNANGFKVTRVIQPSSHFFILDEGIIQTFAVNRLDVPFYFISLLPAL